MAPKGDWPRCATFVGSVSCAMIALALVVPWYSADYTSWDGPHYRVEYSVEMDRASGLMSTVAVILILSLSASILAVVFSYLNRRISGVVAGGLSAGLLFMAAAVFYFGIIYELRLDYFAGLTRLNRSWTVETAPMLGWWIAAAVPVAHGAQAVVLAYSDDCDSRRIPLGRNGILRP